MREAGYFRGGEAEEWDVANFGAEGLTLYLAAYGGRGEGGGEQLAECYVFIPAAEVVAVHNVGAAFFEYLRRGRAARELPAQSSDAVN